jgi:hypothetical protein
LSVRKIRDGILAESAGSSARHSRFDPLIGYPDSGVIGIAMANGELRGYCGFTLSAIKSARPATPGRRRSCIGVVCLSGV